MVVDDSSALVVAARGRDRLQAIDTESVLVVVIPMLQLEKGGKERVPEKERKERERGGWGRWRRADGWQREEIDGRSEGECRKM